MTNETEHVPTSSPAVGVAKKVLSLTLKPEDPQMRETVYRIHKDRIIVGSIVSADVRLTGEGIAPIHAVIELERDGVTGADCAVIYDLASDTGVCVNGEKVVTQALKEGDSIRIGEYALSLTLDNPEEISRNVQVRESEGRKLFLRPDEDLDSLLLEEEREVQEIFDYGPSQKRALQVFMSWRGTVLAAEHFVSEDSVKVGPDRSNDFGIPPVLSSPSYAIVNRSGDQFMINLDPGMRGVLQKKGQLKTFDQLRSEGGDPKLPLDNGDFAKVSLGEVDFYLCYSAAPPRLKPGRIFERDPLLARIMLSSGVLTAVLLTALLKMNVPHSLEAEQIPERIATILYQPEKYALPKTPIVPVPKATETSRPKIETKPQPETEKVAKVDIKPKGVDPKKPVPKEMIVGGKPTKVADNKKIPQNLPQKTKGQTEAQEGQGARAKGTEGSRGDKNGPKDSVKQDEANRPSAVGGAGKGGGNSQAGDEGNVDFLKAATGKIENILGSSTAQLGKGGEKLKGFGGFTTQGNGGLALSGDGKGGGGDAASLGGLSDKGRGGGRIGTGKGAAGNGTGIVGGQARVAIRTGGPEEAVVMGAIDADAVEAALLAHRDEFRLCYEREINAEHPGIAGRVSTSFVIGSSGRVTQAGIASTTLNNASTEGCILTVIKRIDFPIPRGAGMVQVTYPFKFSPVGR